MRTLFLNWPIGWLGLLAWILSAPLARSAVPEPIARWTFDGDARDSVGSLHGELLGDATLSSGRLVVGGNGQMRSALLPVDLAAKTLVARVKADPLSQGGGGVLSVQSTDGLIFDAIVYGERRPGEWIAGSDEFRRTQDLFEAFPEEARAGFVELAITYTADGTITVYRNGLPYGQPYRPAMGLQTFSANSSEVLLGMRHGPRERTGGNYFLRGEIDEAALYDRALSASEVAELAGVGPVDDQEQVVLGFATSELVMEESTIGSIVVRRTGRLDQRVSATLELRAGSAEVTGEGADLFLRDQNPAVLTFQPGQTEMAVQIQARLD